MKRLKILIVIATSFLLNCRLYAQSNVAVERSLGDPDGNGLGEWSDQIPLFCGNFCSLVDLSGCYFLRSSNGGVIMENEISNVDNINDARTCNGLSPISVGDAYSGYRLIWTSFRTDGLLANIKRESWCTDIFSPACSHSQSNFDVVLETYNVVDEAGLNEVCPGEIVQLSNHVSYSANTTWSGPGVRSFSVFLGDPFNGFGLDADQGLIDAGSSNWTITASKNYNNGLASFSVNINYQQQSLSVTPDFSVCVDSSPVSLTGSPGGGSWSGAGVSGTSFNPSSAGVGTHTLTYTFTQASTGCQFATTTRATVNGTPNANAGPNRSVCSGESITLSGSASGGGGGYSYSWSPSTGLNNPNVAQPSASPVVNTTYTLTVTDANGCTDTDQATVTVNPAVSANAGSDLSICPGGNIGLNGSATGGNGVFSYGWTPSSGLSDVNISNPIASPNVTTNYTLTITDGNGCSDVDLVTVTVHANPTVLAGNDVSICLGESASLQASGSGGSGSGFLYNWSPTNGLSDPLIDDPEANPTTTTTYTVTLTDSNGCQDTDQITVTVNPLPFISFINSTLSFCEDDPVFNLNNNIDPSILGGTWTGEGVSGVNLDPGDPDIGTHQINYTFTDSNGCTNTNGFDVVILPVPDLTFTTSLIEICETETTFDLFNSNPSITGGVWDQSTFVTGSIFDASSVPVIPGSYSINYTAGEMGCERTEAVLVRVSAITQVNAGPDLSFCVNDGNLLITGASPGGGSWSGPGVGGGFFSPSSLTAGTYTITYSFVNNDGCQSFDSREFTVNDVPMVDAGSDLTLCFNDPVYALTNDVNITGGNFSSPSGGVSGLNFIPNLAGIGVHEVTYSFTDPASGCINMDTRFITVVSPEEIPIGTPPVFCSDDPDFDLSSLSVSIPGGSWSGPGISGSMFSPTSVSPGTHNVTYSVIDVNNCTATAPLSIEVEGLPIVEAGPDIFVCSGAPIVPLAGTGNPIGGSWSGNFILGENFDVGSSGPGVFTVTYLFTSLNSCTSSDTKNIIVDTGTVVNAGPDIPACENDPLIDLASRVSPGGGSFTGPGIAGNNFDPGIGAGTYTITYSLNNEFGCAGTDDILITVNAEPDVDAGTGNSLCLNEPPVDLTLTAFPQGGFFTGPGVAGGTHFDPSIAGVGNHQVTYNFTNGANCSGRDIRTVTVTALNEVTAGPNLFMCISNGIVDLDSDVDPGGGLWSGPGLTFGIFDPNAAGIGTHELIYTVIEGNGCTSSDQKIVTVFEDLTIDVGPDLETCSNAGLINLNEGNSLPGGDWEGQGVSGTSFDPSDVGPGSYFLTYSFTDQFNCSAVASKIISVFDPASVTIGSNINVCSTASPIDLTTSAFPAGGIFNGSGVVGNLFDPVIAGPGVHEITYSITDLNNCQAIGSRLIEVELPENIDAGTNIITCFSNGVIDLDLGANPSGGTWVGTGVTGSFFNPQFAGIGTHPIEYTLDLGNECIGIDSKIITVREDLTVNAGDDLTFCVNDPAFSLLNESNRPGGSWSGNGVSGNLFSPGVAGIGNHQLNYTFTDAFGCMATDSKNVTVNNSTSVDAGPDVSVCNTSGLIDLSQSVSPQGGIWSGPGISGNSFNASQVGNGIYDLVYTFIDQNSCEESDIRRITVSDPTPIDAGPNRIICLNSGVIDLDLDVSIIGGNWSGSPALSGSFFDPQIAGTGTFQLTYILDESGCISSDNRTITVRDNVTVDAGVDLNFCVDGGAHSLLNDADKPGGLWSGIGVEDGIFDPAISGEGTFTISYQFIDNFACQVTDQRIFTVHPSPQVDAGPAMTLCTTSSPLNLSSSVFPVGGSWSGQGIVGNSFDPSLVGTGDYTLLYSFTDLRGCINSDTRLITVENPAAVEAGSNLEICIDSEPIDLDLAVSETGGNWSGAGIEGSFFNPVSAGLGSHLITYSIDQGDQCLSIDTKTINVREPIVVDAGPNLIVCEDDGVINLSGQVEIPGGIWFGNAVSENGLFNTTEAGVGEHTLFYSVSNAFDCVAADSRIIEVVGLPSVSAGVDIEMCVDSSPVNLEDDVFPSGGAFTGTGLLNTIFDPLLAGPGEHTIQYNVTAGCANSDSRIITVNNLPLVNAGSDFEVCVNADPITLDASQPEDGVWSGPAIIAGVFDPRSAGEGSHLIVYEFTGENGCFNADEITITCLAEPELNIGTPLQLCLNDLPVSLSGDVNLNGGVFDGPGITGDFFNPAQAGTGSHVITYTLPFNGCDLIEFRNVTVNDSDDLDIGEDIILCIDSDPVDLLLGANIIGGVFQGPGVAGNIFDPGSAGLGSHLIKYDFSNAFGCVSSDQRIITVQEEIVIFAGNNLSICNSVDSFDLAGLGSPSGGVYIGEGVTNNAFSASTTGIGEFTISYIVDNGNGCVSRDDLNITVSPSTITDFGKDTILCITSNPLELNFSSELVGGNWNGPGVVDNMFYPAIAQLGTFDLNYSNTGEECDVAGIRRVTVLSLPESPGSAVNAVEGCQGDFITLEALVNEEDRNSNVGIEWFREDEIDPFALGERIAFEITREERIFFDAVNPFGCSSGQRDFINVSTNNPSAQLIADDTTILFGRPVQFFAENLDNVESIEWDFGDGLKSFERNPFHYYYESGTFDVTLRLTSASGCVSEIIKEDYIIVAQEQGRNNGVITGISQVGDLVENNNRDLIDILRVYPNPFKNYLEAELLTSSSGEYIISAIDLTGQSVKLGQSYLKKGFNKIVIDGNDLLPGMHFIRLIRGEQIFQFKTLKE